jgi:hypothetical protein
MLQRVLRISWIQGVNDHRAPPRDERRVDQQPQGAAENDAERGLPP